MNISPADLATLADTIAEAVAERLVKKTHLVDRCTLAKVLGVGVSTIERMQRTGEIPVVRIGCRVKYDVDAVVAALSHCKAAAGGGLALAGKAAGDFSTLEDRLYTRLEDEIDRLADGQSR